MKNLTYLLIVLMLFACNNEEFLNSEYNNEIPYYLQQPPNSGEIIIVDDFLPEDKTTDIARYAAVEGYTIKGTTITAGTGEEIEIFGSGFGDVQGVVSIGVVNIGENLNIVNEFKAWTDTYIRVRVRSGSRSGVVVVTLADKVTKITVGDVTVKFSVHNWNQQYDLYPYWEAARFQHSGNAQGIIEWHFITGGYSAALKDNFRKALAEWNQKTGINWILGDDVPAPTTAEIGKWDGIHTVTVGPSPGGAHFGARWTDCGVKNTWYPGDTEIVFDEMQGYTTVLHELGHAAGLGHTSGVGGIMSSSGGSAIGAYDIEGVKNQVNYDISKPIGCAPNMIAFYQPTLYTYYLDGDLDGYGNPNVFILATKEPASDFDKYVLNNKDCNDSNGLINPSAIEIKGNGIDENCNGMRDDRVKGGGKPGG